MKKKKTVLLADDDIDLIETMKIVLEAEGLATINAYDTAAAFARLKTEKPDLMVLDVMFGSGGKTNGLELVSKIRRDAAVSGTLILMITSVSLKLPVFDILPKKDGMPAGRGKENAYYKPFAHDASAYLPVDGFINKPAQPEELVAKVRALLEKRTSKWAGWKIK